MKKSVDWAIPIIGIGCFILLMFMAWAVWKMRNGYEAQLHKKDMTIQDLRIKNRILSEIGTRGWYEVKMDSVYVYEYDGKLYPQYKPKPDSITWDSGVIYGKKGEVFIGDNHGKISIK